MLSEDGCVRKRPVENDLYLSKQLRDPPVQYGGDGVAEAEREDSTDCSIESCSVVQAYAVRTLGSESPES